MPVLSNGSSGWTDIRCDARSAAEPEEKKPSSEGNREIEPNLDRPNKEAAVQVEPYVSPEIDDDEDVGSQQTLETIRRAAALDLADDNTLPEF